MNVKQEWNVSIYIFINYLAYPCGTNIKTNWLSETIPSAAKSKIDNFRSRNCFQNWTPRCFKNQKNWYWLAFCPQIN